jgi:excinuclease ABC subunit B
MKAALDETEKRRKIQLEYNERNGIVPQTIKKKVLDVIEIGMKDDDGKTVKKKKLSKKDIDKAIEELTREMKECAKKLDFERAAYLRDLIVSMQKENKTSNK